MVCIIGSDANVMLSICMLARQACVGRTLLSKHFRCPERNTHLKQLRGSSQQLPRLLTMVGAHPKDAGWQKQWRALDKAKIVPDLVDQVDDTHAVSMHIRYGDHMVANGTKLKPAEAQEPPHVEIVGEGMYSLVMTDLDPPSPENPKWREFLHWVVANVPNGEWAYGHEVIPYMGPAPPAGTHRYCFVLFRNHKDMPMEVKAPKERKLFNTRSFMEEHGLGPPIHVDWFVSSAPHEEE